MYIVLDTETRGRVRSMHAALYNSDNWPRVFEVSWNVYDVNRNLLITRNFVAAETNDYSFHHRALCELKSHLKLHCKYLCGHNIEFDVKALGAELFRLNGNFYGILSETPNIQLLDTMMDSRFFCALDTFHWPTLEQLHLRLFGIKHSLPLHSAANDATVTADCLFELIRLEIIKPERNELPHESIRRKQEEEENEWAMRCAKGHNRIKSTAIPLANNQGYLLLNKK